MIGAEVLRVRNLRIEIAGRLIVQGVDLSLAPGECLAIVGGSGSGKTMTASALLGLAPSGALVSADELVIGTADVRGFTERGWRSIRGRSVGLVSQDALVCLDPLRRVGREVAEAIEIHAPTRPRREMDARVLGLLRSVAVPNPELRSRQYPHELSGGLRQRALIASALAAAPAMLIADEPTTALDVTVQAQILTLLGELKAAGLALLLISHDLAVVAHLADRIAVMKDGAIVEQGPAAKVLGDPQHPYTRALLAAVPTVRSPRERGSSRIVLEARDLGRSYRLPDRGLTRAVDAVSFSLRSGRTLGVVGESGSGKSTLARMLMGTEVPDSGEVLLDDRPWSALSESARRPLRARIQSIDQDPFGAFDPRFTVARILGEAIALSDTSRAERKARSVELLGQVGLAEDLLPRRARQLSGGQRQRLAIARALARRPEILICDEPVSALDLSIQAQVLELLAELQQRLGLAMVFISHDLAVIGQVSDDVLVMRDGVVVETGPAAAVLGSPRHPFTKQLLDSVPRVGLG